MQALDRRAFWAALPAFMGLGALAVVAHRLAPREPYSAIYWALTAATIALWAGLSLMALWQRGADRRVRLFAATAVTVSLTTVMPQLNLQWPAWLLLLAIVGYAIAYFGNVPVVVHLASEIPGAHPFVARHPSFIRWNYAVGALMCAALVAVFSIIGFGNPGPGVMDLIDWSVSLGNRLYYLYAGAISIWLLFTAGRAERLAYRRRQAFVVLSAVLIWTAQNVAAAVVPQLWEVPFFVNVIEPLTFVASALALAIAVFGYHLLDIGSILRKGVVFGVSVAGLFLLLYLAITSGTGAIEQAIGVSVQPFVTIAAFVAVALLFDPLSKRLSHAVDRAFFPEKLAVRRLERMLFEDTSGETTIEGIGARLVERLVGELGASSAALLLIDDAREVYRVRAMAGEVPGGERAREVVVPIGAEIPAGLPCETIVRVEFGGDPLAIVCLGPLRSGAVLDADDRDALTHIAQQLAAMIENARLFELARVDALTGLARRHVFEEQLRQEAARSARTGRPYAVALIDVDWFKRVNDRYGHGAGDAVLRRTAAVLLENCRSLDLVARYGGEEFAVLFPETDVESGRIAAEKLRAAVETARFEAGSHPLRITISAGVAESTGMPETTVTRADEALYAAKRAGRNQVR